VARPGGILRHLDGGAAVDRANVNGCTPLMTAALDGMSAAGVSAAAQRHQRHQRLYTLVSETKV
jgi:hypothetical protein